MLMAATYSREVVAADGLVKKNPNLKGGALHAALKNRELLQNPWFPVLHGH